MSLAKTLMVQGTASTVGKSTLVAGLCRLFAQDGWRVAPFKAQNMALNSWVTGDGKEMGRAQVVQAEAAGIEPSVEMNPILLKPESMFRSQVIVMGRPLSAMEAREYYRNRSSLFPVVEKALNSLRTSYDLVIIEGAGSPVELNLAQYDLVNMAIARLSDAPVLLVGDIDRGGIFASLLGTLMLLEPSDRARVKGLIVNKFRGDLSLWHAGEQLLAERSRIPVLGTVPFFQDICIAEEDTVALDNGAASVLRSSQDQTTDKLEIVVVRFPYLSNYDEFDALASEPAVRLHFVSSPTEFPAQSDLIILPGTKNTLADLGWLWQRGLAQHIRLLAKKGSALFGICGGYQMLGQRIYDLAGTEGNAGSVEPGLHLLPIETIFTSIDEKITMQSQVKVAPLSLRGLFAGLNGQKFQTYQLHVGRSSALLAQDGSPAFEMQMGENDGWCSSDGWCVGCYLHGLFENDLFRQKVLMTLIERRSMQPTAPDFISFDRQIEYDKLAALLRKHLTWQQLKEVCGLL